MLLSDFRKKRNSSQTEGAPAYTQAPACASTGRKFSRRSLSVSSAKHRRAAPGKISVFTSFVRRKFYALRLNDATRRRASGSVQMHWQDLQKTFAALVTERDDVAFWSALRNLGQLLTQNQPAAVTSLQLAKDRDQHLMPLQAQLATADLPQLQALAQILKDELASDGAHLDGNSEAVLLLAEINVLVWDALKSRLGLQETENIQRASTALTTAIEVARRGDLNGVMQTVEQMFQDAQTGVATLLPYAQEGVDPMVVAFWYALPAEPEQRALLLHCLAPQRAAALAAWLAGARGDGSPEHLNPAKADIEKLVARERSSLEAKRHDALNNFLSGQRDAQAAAVKALYTLIASWSGQAAELDAASLECIARHLRFLGYTGPELPQFLMAGLELALKKISVPALKALAGRIPGLVDAAAQQVAGAKACVVAIAQMILTAAPKRAEMEMQEMIERSLTKAVAQLGGAGKPESVVSKLHLLMTERAESGCWSEGELAQMREHGLNLIIDRLEQLDLAIAKQLLVPLTRPDAEELLNAMNAREAKAEQHIANWWLQHMLLRGEINAEYERLTCRVAEAGAEAIQGEIEKFAQKMTACRDALSDEKIRWPEHFCGICEGVVVFLCNPELQLLQALSEPDLDAALELYQLGRSKTKEIRTMIEAERTRREDDQTIARMGRIDAHGQQISNDVTVLVNFLRAAKPGDSVNLDLISQLAASEAALQRELGQLPEEQAVDVILRKQLGKLSVAQWRVIEQHFSQLAQAEAANPSAGPDARALLARIREVLRLQAHDAALGLYEHVRAAHWVAKMAEEVVERFEQLKPELERLPTSEEIMRALAQALNEMEPPAWYALMASLPDAVLADLTACASAQDRYAKALQERTSRREHERALEAELDALAQSLSASDNVAVTLPARGLRALIDDVMQVAAHYAERGLPLAEGIYEKYELFCELAGSRRAGPLFEALSDEDMQHFMQHLRSNEALQPSLKPNSLAEMIRWGHQARVDQLAQDAASIGKEIIIAQWARMGINTVPGIDTDAVKKWPAIATRMRALEATESVLAGLDQGIREDLAKLDTNSMMALAHQLSGLEATNPTVALFQQTVMAAAVAIRDSRQGSDVAGPIAQAVTEALRAMCAAPEHTWPASATAAMAPYFQQMDQSDAQKTGVAHPVVGKKVLSALEALTSVQLRQMMLRAPQEPEPEPEQEWLALFAKADANSEVGKAYRWYHGQKIFAQQLQKQTQLCIETIGTWLGDPSSINKGAMEAALAKLPLVLQPLQRMHAELGTDIRTELGRTLHAELPQDLIGLLEELNNLLVAPNRAELKSKEPVPLAHLDKKVLAELSAFFMPFGYAEKWKMAVNPSMSSKFASLFNV